MYLRMRNTAFLTFILIFSLLITACSAQGDPRFEGRIVDKDGSKLLVVEGISKDEMTDDIKSILQSGKYSHACWVTKKWNPLRNYKVGQQVKVWFNTSDDSYPCQTTAQKIEVVDE